MPSENTTAPATESAPTAEQAATGRRVRAAKGQDQPFSIAQRLINSGLDDALCRARRQPKLELKGASKYIIFSDHHKGMRNGADDFTQCKDTYVNALKFYCDQGYTLIILGDAEELWEEKPGDVIRRYREVLDLEGRFHAKQRYMKLYGNHDDDWKSPKKVREYLHDFFPHLEVREGLVISFHAADGTGGEIFLAHGHQGTLDSDFFRSPARWVVRTFYRAYQILTGHGRTTPAMDACLRAQHDTQMYRWASQQENLILIAGHTHRPVWTSKTHLDQLMDQLWLLVGQIPTVNTEDTAASEEMGAPTSSMGKTKLARKSQGGPVAKRIAQDKSITHSALDDDRKTKISELVKRINDRESKYPPCSDTLKSLPAYFNTGCCRFADGDITGIELAEEEMRLIRWAKASDEPSGPSSAVDGRESAGSDPAVGLSMSTTSNRQVLGQIRLDHLFFLLDCFKRIS